MERILIRNGGGMMAAEASLLVRLHDACGRLEDILAALHAAGWGIRDGKTEYLPVQDDMYDWQKAYLSPEEFCAIIREKQRLHEQIGVILYYQDTEIAFMLLARDADEITFGLDIGRKTMAEGMTDVSWYLTHVIVPLKRAGFTVYHIEFNECAL